MSKKQLTLLAIAFLMVAGIYYYLYKDSFIKPGIHISHTFRPRSYARAHKPGSDPDNEDINNVLFSLFRDYKLTAIKVICVNELATNEFPHPIWELATESNSMPTRIITYGANIRGMHPVVKGAVAEPLEPNKSYRLLLEAGTLKGQHDFLITEESHLAK